MSHYYYAIRSLDGKRVVVMGGIDLCCLLPWIGIVDDQHEHEKEEEASEWHILFTSIFLETYFTNFMLCDDWVSCLHRVILDVCAA